MRVKENLEAVKKKLPAGCTLVAVTKTHSPETIIEAYNAGHRIFGENKVQELLPKYEQLPKDIQWHLIGHLQSNKVKYIVPFVSLIHGVDSEKLLEEIQKQASRINRTVECLLQVHIAREESKFGFSETEIENLIDSRALPTLTHVRIRGLMGMATFTDNHEQVQGEFRTLKNLFDKFHQTWHDDQFTVLSMGMSGDYHIAIREGSNMVRIGSAIFGAR